MVLTHSARLARDCTYTAGVTITASGVTLDCRGATIPAPRRRAGIEISAPTTTALHDVHVRNCRTEGFLNGIRVTRDGFRDLAAGVEYDHAFDDISVEDSTVSGARGVGIFVDGDVTGVTIRGNQVVGNGSSGIYLDRGSGNNVVEANEVRGNGFVENGPEGTLTTIGGLTVRFWGPGRERPVARRVANQPGGGQPLPGQFGRRHLPVQELRRDHLSRPDRWFAGRTPADGNVIEHNTFDAEGLHGVWVASRMGENTAPMECSDPANHEAPLERVVLDHAAHNVVRANTFHDVTYGVHVEDDDTTVEGNTFTGTSADRWAVTSAPGCGPRSSTIPSPAPGSSTTPPIAGNPSPYRWVHGRGHRCRHNTALGHTVGICQQPSCPTTP